LEEIDLIFARSEILDETLAQAVRGKGDLDEAEHETVHVLEEGVIQHGSGKA
jgi:hypothetical protein